MNHGRDRYRADIDGLRAVAVIVVVLFHAFPALLPGGFVGVDVFFVISGYLISGIILTAIHAGRFSFAHFYARRIRRIFPALTIVLAAVMAVGWFGLYADDYARLARHVAAGAAFASNFALWQESSYFDVAAELKPLLHLWSLGIEEQFYLVWPLLLVTAARWRRGPLALTLFIAAISFLLSIWTVRIDRTPAFYAPWNRFWELLAGAMLACTDADEALRAGMRRLADRRWVGHALGIAGIAMILAGVLLIDSTRVFPGLWVLLPVAGTAALIVAGPRSWINRSLLSQPLVVWVGLISYPLYLWHWPLLSLARVIGSDTPEVSVRVVLIALSVLLAWLTYAIAERPIRFTLRSPIVVPAVSTAMVAVFAWGLATNVSGGFVERPVNRNSAAKLVEFYERMRRSDLPAAYRYECDFMDTRTEQVRPALDPSCTAPGREQTYFLWGDSFAQSLSRGIREQLPAATALAQVATSACLVSITNFDLTVPGRRCERANVFAMEAIQRLRPAVAILAQSGGHAIADWKGISAKALELGAGHVIVVGPFPIWRPSLPAVYAEHHLTDHAEYVGTGLDQESFAIDRTLASELQGLNGVTYVSLLDRLCDRGACLARVPGEGELDLMAVDFGHLSPKGSSYVGRAILKPYFDRLTQRSHLVVSSH